MSRITETFERLGREGRCALMPYLAIGYPELDSALELAPAIVEGGADLIELGMPFSDPLADGATVQRATQQALRNGVTLDHCIETVRRLRAQGVTVPLLLMGYYNPIFQRGEERFVAEVAAAGGDGLIVPDLPPEEADVLQAACRAHGLDLIMFLAPTSTDERIAQVSQLASGFIYCVGLAGVTGARAELAADLGAFLDRVGAATKVPRAVGFGISRPEHVARVAQLAEGAIVGSAVINQIEQLPAERRRAGLRDFVAALGEATRGARD